jgi:hypothetical protein
VSSGFRVESRFNSFQSLRALLILKHWNCWVISVHSIVMFGPIREVRLKQFFHARGLREPIRTKGDQRCASHQVNVPERTGQLLLDA